MNWSVLIWFGVGIGAYLIGLGVFTLIKFIFNKRKFKKEVASHEKENSEDKNLNA